MYEMTLDDAIMLVEAFGLRVVSKDRVKNLSYNVMINLEKEILYKEDKEILDLRAKQEAFESLSQQLEQSKAIQFSERKLEGENPMNLIHQKWNLTAIV